METFGQRDRDTRRKSLAGRNNSQCKGPGAETCLTQLRSCKEASVAVAEREVRTRN